MSAIARGVLLKEECQIRNFCEKLSISCAALDSGPIKWSKKKKKFNLRNDAVPAVTFILAILEYCCRALARWTAAVSTADMLRKPAKLKNWKTLDKRTENASPINKFKRKIIFVFFFRNKKWTCWTTSNGRFSISNGNSASVPIVRSRQWRSPLQFSGHQQIFSTCRRCVPMIHVQIELC